MNRRLAAVGPPPLAVATTVTTWRGDEPVGQTQDRERLATGQAQRRGVLARLELERQHAHPDQVGPVDPLVRLGDDGLTPSSVVPLAAQSRDEPEPYSRPGQQDERRALGGVAHRDVVDEARLAIRQVDGERPLAAVGQRVAQPDVRERAADHHLVLAAPGPVRVEVERADAVGLEPRRRPATTGEMEPAGEM